MDRQNGSLKGNRIHTLKVVCWLLFSTIVYGFTCILVSVFSKNIARIIARYWNVHLLKVAGVNIVVNGMEKLNFRNRYVYISNHQSGLDIPILYAGLSHKVSFIAKKELFMIPVFGWGLYATGHIWIDRGNARRAHHSMERAVRRLKKDNVSLILFPEGTRSKDGKVAPFKQGSFSLALKSGVDVVPVSIRNAIDLLPKHANSIVPGTVYLDIGDPVTITPEMSKAELAEKFHAIISEKVNEKVQ